MNSLWLRRYCGFLLAAACLAQSPAITGRKALDTLLTGDYGAFSLLLTDEAKSLLTPEFLKNRVGGEIAGFGKLEQVGQPVTAKAGSNDFISFPTRFSKTTVDIQLTLNESGHVAGLHFRPPDQPLPPVWTRPAYSDPARFSERPVMIGDDPWKLGGTITVPAGKGPFPAIVLVHGPGPNDRDESMFANRIFADLAEGLSTKGFVVLRYDKRTKVHGREMSETEFTLREETIDDAVLAIATLRQQPEADKARVFAIGHSLGGYALPRIAADSAKRGAPLAGAVFLAANARRIEDISIAQTEFMLQAKGGASPEERRRLDGMKEQADVVRKLTPEGQNPPILLGLPAAYFLDLKGYDAAHAAGALGIPLLFLQGERDFQVTMDDLNLWKAGVTASRLAAFRTYPSLSHLFIAGEGPGSPAEYRKAGNVAPAVIDDIAQWLSAQTR